jgi:hypothetical protein
MVRGFNNPAHRKRGSWAFAAGAAPLQHPPEI